MTYPVIHTCPVCKYSLHVQKLACGNCHTVIENDFSLSKFASLSKEQMDFVEVFVVKRGNIKGVEKELGISYPTVRSKLNDIVEQLGYEEEQDAKPSLEEDKKRKMGILDMLEKEEIDAQEALARLKNKK